MDACFMFLELAPRKVTYPITFVKGKIIEKYDTGHLRFLLAVCRNTTAQHHH